MPRGLDHIVHVVRDLDAAGEIYDLIGFTVGPRNQHPWGTYNRIVQMPGFFIELLAVAEPDKIPESAGSHFSFGAFNRDFLARCGEGFSMLALEGVDPAADKAAFDAAGFGGFDLFDFSRMARRPDGEEVEVGFSLAFAQDPAAPDAGFFTSTQRKPENFWVPAMQRHHNGVAGVTGVVLVADHPVDHASFIDTLTGATPLRVADDWYLARTPRGEIEIMARPAFAARFNVAAPGLEGLRIAAIRFAVAGTAEMRRGLAARRMIEEASDGAVVVPARAALGAILVVDRMPNA
ncbi:VOC family protein [Aquabacter spiritensis]|uniref:Glyoxalase-like protein n=1 Tax=Aquabacter spiritensis TaxID=933073 RepID=A0A4V6NZJ0_9HYPH|nr:VOC family protein [Aquabacter spiritensis]TCT04678.1 glyoxalase-like protein [Aquabacter spiritensis]